jgi:hypothetical protein
MDRRESIVDLTQRVGLGSGRLDACLGEGLAKVSDFSSESSCGRQLIPCKCRAS